MEYARNATEHDLGIHRRVISAFGNTLACNDPIKGLVIYRCTMQKTYKAHDALLSLPTDQNPRSFFSYHVHGLFGSRIESEREKEREREKKKKRDLTFVSFII